MSAMRTLLRVSCVAPLVMAAVLLVHDSALAKEADKKFSAGAALEWLPPKDWVDFEKMGQACAAAGSICSTNKDDADACGFGRFCMLENGSKVPSQTDVGAFANRWAKSAPGEVTALLNDLKTSLSGSTSVGINQGAILLGATDFLLERARVELQTWLTRTFFSKLCETGDEGEWTGGDLLVETCALITSDVAGDWLSQAGFRMLQKLLLADLAAMPRHAAEKLANDLVASKTCGGKSPCWQLDAAMSAAVLGRVLEAVVEGKSPFDAFSSWGAKPAFFEMSLEQTPLASALHIAAAITATFPRREGKVTYPANVKSLHFALLAAMVNKRSQADAWPKGFDFAELVTYYYEVSNVWDSNIADKADAFLKGLEALDSALGSAKKKMDSKDLAAAGKLLALAEVVAAACDLADVPLGLARQLADKAAAGDAEALDSLGKAVELVHGVRTTLTALAQSQWSLAVRGALDTLEEAGVKIADVPPMARRAILFAAELAMVQDAESAKAAIEAFAAPPGGYLAKRTDTGVNFSLTGHIGLAAGREWVMDAKEKTDGWTAAPAMMVGPEMTFAATECGWSFGLFASVLDLGQLMSYRIDYPEDNESAPNVGFAEVFAPGAFLVIGFPMAPFALGLGTAWTPELRQVKDTAAPAEGDPAGTSSPEWEAKHSFRLGAFLSMDLWLFP